MVCLDGATTKDDDRVLIIGATNRPQELDDAIRRRLVKRLYIPLPEDKVKEKLIINVFKPTKYFVYSRPVRTCCAAYYPRRTVTSQRRTLSSWEKQRKATQVLTFGHCARRRRWHL